MKTGRMTFCICRVFLALLVLARICEAQTPGPSDQEAIALLALQIQELQQHDLDLQERIKVLEANQKGVLAAPEPKPVTDILPQTEAQTAPPPLSPDLHIQSSFRWRGFAEINYKVLDQRAPELGAYGFVPGSAGNFYTADFGLFLTARLTSRASILSEIVFEEGDAQAYRLDLRRLLLRYDYNDHLKMSFGRYQTNIGYYNWAFRSAAWLQTTADRPLVMEFASNGGPLPTQAIGVSITGSLPSGPLGLNYVAEYGSSDTVRPDLNADGVLTDENNGNHINVGIFLRPDRAPGLQIDGSIDHDQISNLDLLHGVVINATSARWGQTIVNGYAVYVSPRMEFLNEVFLIRDALIGGALTFNTPAFYSQISRKFGPIRPFVRYQYVNASPRDLIYDDIGLRYGPSFGARYDLNDYLAFKAQLDHTVRRGLPDLNGLHLQLAVTF